MGTKEKKKELKEDQAWYLIARTEEGTAVAFVHFRFDMDYDDEVLYCYEVQVEKAYRRKGLGRFMMKLLEMLAIKNDLPEVAFFRESLKFEMDETSFVDTVHEQFEYEILSRYNLIKKKKVDAEEAAKENTPAN